MKLFLNVEGLYKHDSFHLRLNFGGELAQLRADRKEMILWIILERSQAACQHQLSQ